MLRLPAAVATLLLVTSACTTNPITGRSQLTIVSSEMLESAAVQTYSQLLAKPRAEGRVNSDADMVQRVRGIANRLISNAGRHYPHSRNWPWEVNVVNSKVINAMCLPRGRIVVTSAIVNDLRLTDDEIAVLLGHEIGHALAEHAAEKVSMQILVNAGLQGLMRQSKAARSAPQLTVELSRLMVTLPYGRSQESESDHIGLVLAHESGYDIESGWSLFDKMGRTVGDRTPEFLSTHPSHETRIAEMKQLIPVVQARQRSTTVVARGPASASSGAGAIAAISSANTRAATAPDEMYRYGGVQFGYFPTPEIKQKKPEGKWSFEAHRAVKSYQQCFLDRLELLEVKDGAETYAVGCHDKTRHDVVCESTGVCLATPAKT